MAGSVLQWDKVTGLKSYQIVFTPTWKAQLNPTPVGLHSHLLVLLGLTGSLLSPETEMLTPMLTVTFFN